MRKSTLFTAVAALALVGPLAITSASAQQRQRDPSEQGRFEGPTQRAQERDARDEDARTNDDRRDHRDRRESWRDTRDNARWDERQHNGYYINTRWTYGQPSAEAYRREGFELGYRPWAVGQTLGYYNTRYQQVDYRREQLRPPSRGLRWVRDDRGDYLLVNRSGRISQVVISGNEPRDRRQSWRDARNDSRWDDRRHNGYYRNNQWTFGPPPQGRYGRDEVVYGYQPWQRGQRLGYYEGRYSEVDYRTNRSLRAPPRGYHWVRNDGGDYLLAAIAGGVIAQVILNSSR
jgi:Ni/Co efflux regulator RcnB